MRAPLTMQGAQRLRQELDLLKTVKRPEVITAIAEARDAVGAVHGTPRGRDHAAAVTEVVRERADGSLIHFGLDAQGRLVAATSLGRGPVVAKDIRVAEQLIATHATPDPAALADPGVALRSLR